VSQCDKPNLEKQKWEREQSINAVIPSSPAAVFIIIITITTTIVLVAAAAATTIIILLQLKLY